MTLLYMYAPVSGVGWFGDIIINVVDTLPVGVDGWGARGEGPVQVGV